MPQEFQTSFIPKKSFSTGKSAPSPGGGVAMVVGVTLFIVSIVLAGGVFGYEKLLVGAIETKKASLEKAKEAFDPAIIKELSHFDTKITTAQSLIDNHVAVSALFHLLEENTLQTVQFKSFSYRLADDGISVSMQGEALSFKSVALQSDKFANHPSIQKTFFSNIGLNDIGNVVFSVSMTVDPSVISFTNEAKKGGVAVFEMGADSTAETAQSGENPNG